MLNFTKIALYDTIIYNMKLLQWKYQKYEMNLAIFFGQIQRYVMNLARFSGQIQRKYPWNSFNFDG